MHLESADVLRVPVRTPTYEQALDQSSRSAARFLVPDFRFLWPSRALRAKLSRQSSSNPKRYAAPVNPPQFHTQKDGISSKD
ncbi:unnamed protein product [Lasius platythorax]|uniref:Testicular haploid expressed protein n=1 Tax=Lasius platythorax TaxID=488582 RepID=A0AAV2NVJ8_9HYME